MKISEDEKMVALMHKLTELLPQAFDQVVMAYQVVKEKEMRIKELEEKLGEALKPKLKLADRPGAKQTEDFD